MIVKGKDLISRYINALIELADEKGVLDNVEDDLKLVHSTINDNHDLRQILGHKLVPVNKKKELLQKIFGGSISELVLNYLYLLIDKKRESLIEISYLAYYTFLNERKGIVRGHIKSPYPLSEEKIISLKERLSVLTKKKVEFNVEVSPELIGGIIITLGSKIIDTSISYRLKVMRERLQSITI